MSSPPTSADLPTAIVTAGAVALGTVTTLLVGFSRSPLSPPDTVGGPVGFFVAVTLGTALLTFLLVYGRRIAPPDLLRRGAVSVLLGLAGGVFSFALVSMLSGTFDPGSVPPWVPVVAATLAVGSFLVVGTTTSGRTR
ncbi:MAG: hypothetical protein V5A62_13210 [Haloarculaceae archaeon]